MMNSLFRRSRRIITSPQSSVLSAAFVIMVMVAASRILGLLRQRTLAHYFAPSDLGLFFAAFRLSDIVFEVLVFGTFSSAFIPVFSKALRKGENAWDISGRLINISLVIFLSIAAIFTIAAEPIYALITPGLNPAEISQIAVMARLLFAAQIFFVVSYVVTGVLETMRHFFIPALAPVLYNVGIILGTIILTPYIGLLAPVVGVIIGAFLHLAIQLPMAFRLGFRFTRKIKPNEGVRKIGRLAAPRVGEIAFSQVTKTFELFLSSLISSASITYVTLANSLQLLPVSLFGVPLAKAALPTLTRQDDDLPAFKTTFLSVLYQILFLTAPLAAALIVLRIPFVRLVFGANRFDWEATVQTGFVVSAFAISIPFQAALALLTRAFYALHDTRRPMIVSIITGVGTIAIGLSFVKILHLPAWSLALGYSIGVIFQTAALFVILGKKVNGGFLFSLTPILKSTIAAVIAGLVMFFPLKLFDQSVWVKGLSFLGTGEAQTKLLVFQNFVLDTKYTVNLAILTFVVGLIGGIVYLGVSYLLKSEELASLTTVIKTRAFSGIARKDGEQVTPTTTDTR